MTKILYPLSKFTKTPLTIGLMLIAYGYLCRSFNLYFFWESKSFGWALLFIGVIGLLVDRIKIKKQSNNKGIGEKIGIGFIIFILIIKTILISVMPFTDAYSVTKTFLTNNSALKKELGNIIGFGLMASGGIQVQSNSSGSSGNATINITVKGERGFKDLTVYVVKNADSPVWKVEGME